MDTENPVLLVAAFQRAPNYPRDDNGVRAMAAGLKRAADEAGVSMRSIVNRCLVESPRCPTDAEFLGVARGLRSTPQFSTPQPMTCPLGRCDGHGWKIRFWLHTHRRNPTFVERTRISEADYLRIPRERAELPPDPNRIHQETYTDAVRCRCKPVSEAPAPEAPKRVRGELRPVRSAVQGDLAA